MSGGPGAHPPHIYLYISSIFSPSFVCPHAHRHSLYRHSLYRHSLYRHSLLLVLTHARALTGTLSALKAGGGMSSLSRSLALSPSLPPTCLPLDHVRTHIFHTHKHSLTHTNARARTHTLSLSPSLLLALCLSQLAMAECVLAVACIISKSDLEPIDIATEFPASAPGLGRDKRLLVRVKRRSSAS